MDLVPARLHSSGTSKFTSGPTGGDILIVRVGKYTATLFKASPRGTFGKLTLITFPLLCADLEIAASLGAVA